MKGPLWIGFLLLFRLVPAQEVHPNPEREASWQAVFSNHKIVVGEAHWMEEGLELYNRLRKDSIIRPIFMEGPFFLNYYIHLAVYHKDVSLLHYLRERGEPENLPTSFQFLLALLEENDTACLKRLYFFDINGVNIQLNEKYINALDSSERYFAEGRIGLQCPFHQQLYELVKKNLAAEKPLQKNLPQTVLASRKKFILRESIIVCNLDTLQKLAQGKQKFIIITGNNHVLRASPLKLIVHHGRVPFTNDFGREVVLIKSFYPSVGAVKWHKKANWEKDICERIIASERTYSLHLEDIGEYTEGYDFMLIFW